MAPKKGNKHAQNPTRKKAMLTALEGTLGIVTEASRISGIDRSTHYEWLKTDPEYRGAVDSLSNMAIDMVESELFKQIKDGVPTSTIFFLKTKGRTRGYDEKHVIEHHTVDVPLVKVVSVKADGTRVER